MYPLPLSYQLLTLFVSAEKNNSRSKYIRDSFKSNIIVNEIQQTYPQKGKHFGDSLRGMTSHVLEVLRKKNQF